MRNWWPIALVLAACSQNPSLGPGPAPDPAAAFPLRLEPGQRHLVGRDGKPFLIHGDTAWSLVVELSREDAEFYLEDRRRKGFNAVLLELIEHKFSTNAPKNFYGEGPFTTPGDFSTPNERYFAHADWVIRKAAEKGLLVLVTPAYMGWGGGDEGWYQEMVRGGPAKLRGYGRYLGQRYQGFTNLLWVQGGDYSPPPEGVALARALAEGIKEFAPDQLHTAHGAQAGAAEAFPGEAWLDLDNVYTYGPVWSATLEAYARTPKPLFLFESKYENENGADPVRIRAQAYHALLSGASGHLFGNNPVWHFGSGGLQGAPYGWKEALDAQGSRDMAQVKKLFDGLAWAKLVPDRDGTLLTGGRGDGEGRAVAALASDRSFALAYTPARRALTLDLSRLSGPRVEARWYDPVSGRFQPVPGSPFDATGPRSLAPAADNALNQGDWVLLLESR